MEQVRFADDTKEGGVADNQWIVLQRVFNRLEKWALRNLMKLTKGN